MSSTALKYNHFHSYIFHFLVDLNYYTYGVIRSTNIKSVKLKQLSCEIKQCRRCSREIKQYFISANNFMMCHYEQLK